MSIYSYENMIIPSFAFFPTIAMPQVINQDNKKGRKMTEFSKILTDFLDSTLKKKPRKEFIRCTILRKLVKIIRSVLKNHVKIIINSISIEMLKIISENADDLRNAVNKNNLPYVENKKNRKYKSYNDKFCEMFFSNAIIKKVYALYIEYIFTTRNFDQRCKDLGVYCCKKKNIKSVHCMMKWEILKDYLLRELGNFY